MEIYPFPVPPQPPFQAILDLLSTDPVQSDNKGSDSLPPAAAPSCPYLLDDDVPDITNRRASLQPYLAQVENFANGLPPQSHPHVPLQDDPFLSTYGGSMMLHEPLFTSYPGCLPLPSVDCSVNWSNGGGGFVHPCPPKSETTESLSPQNNCWDTQTTAATTAITSDGGNGGSSMPLYPPPENGYYCYDNELDSMVSSISDHSVNPFQVHNFPDLQVDLSAFKGYDSGDSGNLLDDTGGIMRASTGVADSKHPNTPLHDIGSEQKHKNLKLSCSPNVGRTSHRNNSKSSQTSPNRIVKQKRSSASSKPTTNENRNKDKDKRNNNQSSAKRFVCSFTRYGCPHAFRLKNDWMRHVNCQHLQLGFYRCDKGNCNKNHIKEETPPEANTNTNTRTRTRSRKSSRQWRPNDFIRKDLFNNHQCRMHSPWRQRGQKAPTEEEEESFKQTLEPIRKRCWHEQRRPPSQCQCGFCGMFFSGSDAWDKRMEHVGRHFENDTPPVRGGSEVEQEDVYLRDWAVREGIIRKVEEGVWKLTHPVK